MKRYAFKMKLKPGCKDEYKKRHDNIWPEILELLKQQGINDFAIFYDKETDCLFAYQKISGDKDSQSLGNFEAMRKWWDYMSDIMETNEDSSPVSIPLEEVFYME
ncbi:MAG: L-rhamnose mutarotase [Candidatus Marinimicrobia bacterium]|nr:L-rhamnose mutarotase [Candidatus Neomarinimicrobiota bacterium]